MIDPEKIAFERAQDGTPEDFDGHTDFDKLSPEQRLQWLADMLGFYHEVHRGRDQQKDKAATNEFDAGPGE